MLGGYYYHVCRLVVRGAQSEGVHFSLLYIQLSFIRMLSVLSAPFATVVTAARWQPSSMLFSPRHGDIIAVLVYNMYVDCYTAPQRQPTKNNRLHPAIVVARPVPGHATQQHLNTSPRADFVRLPQLSAYDVLRCCVAFQPLLMAAASLCSASEWWSGGEWSDAEWCGELGPAGGTHFAAIGCCWTLCGCGWCRSKTECVVCGCEPTLPLLPSTALPVAGWTVCVAAAADWFGWDGGRPG